MAQQSYRANLSAARFPLLAENFGRSVIVNNKLDSELSAPQIYYCHNVMPSSVGMQSVGFKQLIAETDPAEDQFSTVFELRDASENRAFFTHTLDGRNFISLYPYYGWINTTAIPAAVSSSIVVTTARCQGETYIYFSGVGCYKYVFSSNSLVAVTLTSLTAANILGITAAYGYMLAWTATTVAWSSTLDPADFTPSSITGAGSGKITAAAGKIVTCASSAQGFSVFTTNNTIAATYTGNSTYPFNLPEAAGSGGVLSLDHVTFASNASNTYAYTTNGLQVVGSGRMEIVYPEITDFISGKRFEDFDAVTNTFTRTALTSSMQRHVRLISDRYLVISYGVSTLTHALILDTSTQRMGKIKLDHVDCFQWNPLSPTVIETPRESIAFLGKDGSVRVIDFDVSSDTNTGVVICGKFCAVRGNFLSLDHITVETVRTELNFAAYSFGEVSAKEDTGATELTLMAQTSATRQYGVNKIYLNHSLIFTGSFDLSELELVFHLAGEY